MPYKKYAAYLVVFLVLLGLGIFFFTRKPKPVPVPVVIPKVTEVREVIGTSTEGRIIESYNYGSGSKQLLFVGGMHGGYEWNSVLLAYGMMDYLKANLNTIPADVTVSVIPDLNPDGVYKVVGKEGRFLVSDVSTDKTVLASGRFNANKVDLNRNFGCKWQADATWQNKKESAGTKAFSESEALTLKNYVEKVKPKAVVFWHSQANAVYASECKEGVLPITLDIMKVYAAAGGYPSVKSFDAYPVTGDAEGWLASIGIPAITVELSTHQSIEWDKNLAGVNALLNYFK